MTKPIALTDHQLRQVMQAAGRLPPSQRSDFLERVAKQLGAEPADTAVQAAIDAALAVGRLPVFLK